MEFCCCLFNVVVDPFVFGPAVVVKLYASFLVWHYLSEEEKTGCFKFCFYSESCGLKGVR